MTENDDFEIETEPDVEATDEFQKKITLRKTEVKKIFAPSRPVTDQNIFSGRKEQLKECCSILETPGLHGILYGERGVGKTSFANIISIFLKAGFVVDGKVDDVNIAQLVT